MKSYNILFVNSAWTAM